MWRHFACSLKSGDVGYFGKNFGVGESRLLALSMGEWGMGKVSVLENGGEHWSNSSKQNPQPVFWCKLKKTKFLLNFASNFLLFPSFFLLFCTKNVKKAYSNQSLECAAHKHWSKYTTPMITVRVCVKNLNQNFSMQNKHSSNIDVNN